MHCTPCSQHHSQQQKHGHDPGVPRGTDGSAACALGTQWGGHGARTRRASDTCLLLKDGGQKRGDQAGGERRAPTRPAPPRWRACHQGHMGMLTCRWPLGRLPGWHGRLRPHLIHQVLDGERGLLHDGLKDAAGDVMQDQGAAGQQAQHRLLGTLGRKRLQCHVPIHRPAAPWWLCPGDLSLPEGGPEVR